MEELWKDINKYVGFYQISNLGRVKSLDRYVSCSDGKTRHIEEKILIQTPDKDGYKRVSLTGEDKRRKPIIVHRVLAQHFIPNPLNKPQVNHEDGVKSNNSLSNLSWCTLSENRQHAYNTGLQNSDSRKGAKCNFSTLDDTKVLEIKKLLKDGLTQTKIAELYNITASTISYIHRGLTWKHLNV